MLEQHLMRLTMDGWTVVEDVIPADRVDAVRESVWATVTNHRRADAPTNIGFLPAIINHDQSFADYLAAPPLMDLVRAALGPQVRISFTSAIVNEPGNARGDWHADWPYNQRNAGCMSAPYPDHLMHLTTLWMLSPFAAENGGTFVVSGSHRAPNNPTGGYGVGTLEPYPTETQATGHAGSVLVFDSRLWHATAPNSGSDPRVALAVRYAPWWLDTRVLMPGSAIRRQMTAATGKKENEVPALPQAVFDQLAPSVQELYAHWVA